MISNNEIFDLAIIGAGPAGSTFARILAKLKPELKIALSTVRTMYRVNPAAVF